MHDELERTAESPAASSTRPSVARTEMLDVAGAVAEAERIIGSRVIGGPKEPEAAKALAEAIEAASSGERVAVVAPVERLAAARETLRRIAQSRLGVVAHAMAGHGTEELGALVDLGWGILSACGPEDSFDLALVARRAAEDSGVPFLVVHALARASGPVGRSVAMVGLPHENAVRSFVGPKERVRPRSDASHPSRASLGDRAFSERAPFALGSALREYADISGRRHDVFDKAPLGEPNLVLVGMGPVGDALFCATGELRSRGYDVGAIHVSALRPFPGPRLVKALARALAVTVLEPAEEPLSQGGLLSRELKSAFTDAITWAPGFPGIGRIPKLFVGATGPSFDVADLAAICENMLADERGKRTFSFVDTEQALPRSAQRRAAAHGEREVALRLVLDDAPSADAALSLASATLAATVGLRVQGIVTTSSSDPSATVDVVASRDHARGGMARRGPRLVLATERGAASARAVAPLGEGAILAVLGEGGDPAAALPDASRAIVRERRARVLPLSVATGGDGELARPAAIAGAAVAVVSRALRVPIEGAFVAKVVAEHLSGGASEAAAAAGERAKRAFDATRDVLTVAERETEAYADGGRSLGVA